MDWIHCNTCFIQPREISDRKFMLTSCGHMYCCECLKSATLKEKCAVCGNKYSTIQLSAKMTPDVQEYFTPPDEILKKIIQVLAFQAAHRMRMVTHLKVVDAKYKAAKKEITKLHEINKALQYKLRVREKQLEEFKHGRTVSPTGSLSQPIPQRHSQILTSQQMPGSASHRQLVTPNRLTLQSTISPNSATSSPAPFGLNSPNMTSTPVNSINCNTAYKNVGHLMDSFKSPVSPHTPANNLTMYRMPSHYSSLSTTPKTPSTPGYSPGLPESSSRQQHANSSFSHSQFIRTLSQQTRISPRESFTEKRSQPSRQPSQESINKQTRGISSSQPQFRMI